MLVLIAVLEPFMDGVFAGETWRYAAGALDTGLRVDVCVLPCLYGANAHSTNGNWEEIASWLALCLDVPRLRVLLRDLGVVLRLR